MNTAIEVAAKRGKTGIALSAIESQKKARAALVEERNDSERTIRWLIVLTRRAFAASRCRWRANVAEIGPPN